MKFFSRLLKKRWYIFLILLIAAGIFLYRKNQSEAQVKKQDKYTVKRQSLKEAVSFSGEIDAEQKATLRFQSSGKLTWIGVKEGDYVQKNQLLAYLDQREVQKKFQKYMNSYMKTRWDFETTKDENAESKIWGLSEDAREAARRTVDKAQFDLNNSVLDVEIQNLSLEYSYLRTPIEGIVTSIGTDIAGVNATPAQAEFEIINPNTVYFSASVDQTDVPKIREGMVGTIILDAYPDKEVGATVKSISFTPKTGETGTVYDMKVIMNTDNSSFIYRLGMTGDLEFVVKEKRSVITVPTKFVRSDKDGQYVMKEQNGNQVKTNIKTGDETDEAMEVISGLQEGDIIYD